MRIIKNPELKGILALLLIMAVLGFAMMAMSGKLEQWFGITWFSGARALDKIVFVSDAQGAPDIYIMNTDGSGRTRLTTNAAAASVPAISTTGNRIMFISTAGGASRLVSVGANGGEPTQATTSSGPKSDPAFSPEGKRLSFISGGRIYVADLNGEGLGAVLPTDAQIRASMASTLNRGALPVYSTYVWGPDGRGLAGITNRTVEGEPMTFAPIPLGQAAELPMAINGQPTNFFVVSWFAGKQPPARGGPGDVFVYLPSPDAEPLQIAINVDGQPVTIRAIACAATKPRLAIAGSTGKRGMLALFDADARRLALITRQNGLEIGDLALSPDSGALVVCAKAGGRAGLIKLDLANGQPTSIAHGEFENPRFSPKADKILATQLSPGDKRDIVVIDLSSGQLTKLTNDGHSYDAVWTPASEK